MLNMYNYCLSRTTEVIELAISDQQQQVIVCCYVDGMFIIVSLWNAQSV